jgi:hypothetical protein
MGDGACRQVSANPERVRMIIKLDVASEPISGVLEAGCGAVVEFAGWLELMSALERARARTTGSGPPTRPPSPDRT